MNRFTVPALLVATACAAFSGSSATAQDAPVAGQPAAQPSQADALKASKAAWEKVRDEHKGNYTYTIERISWIIGRRAGSRETVIVVRDNKVVERRYKQTRIPEPGPVAPGQVLENSGVVHNWVEKGDELGKKAGGDAPVTLDGLYARAGKLVAAYDAKHNEFETLNLRMDKAGLLQAAYISNRMIADATPSEEGVLVSTLTFDKAEGAKAAAPVTLTAENAVAQVKAREVDLPEGLAQPEGLALPGGRLAAPPSVFQGAEAFEAAIPDKAQREKALAGLVDSGKETLVFWKWSGSGQDRITAAVEDKDGQSRVVFTCKFGMTRDLRPHTQAFVIPNGTPWEYRDANGKVIASSAPAKEAKPEEKAAANGEVTWDQLVAIVNAGEVRTASQTHDRRVSVTMADGKTYHATEPQIDMIIRLVRNHKQANPAPIATE